MSQENVEIVRRVNDAFHAADWDAALGLYGAEAELDMTRMLAGDVYHGPEEVRKFYTRWIAAWERFQAERLDLIDAGDAVVLVSRITGVGKGSGAEVQMRAADVFFVEDGRIVRHVGYPDAAEALADLGLSTQSPPLWDKKRALHGKQHSVENTAWAMSRENVDVTRRAVPLFVGLGLSSPT